MMARAEKPLVLAGMAGEYRELRPAAALEPHFECLWTNTLGRDDASRMAVVPDGCVDLTWFHGDVTVAGPDVTAHLTPVVPDSTVIGVRFRPGAATRWLGLPMSELVGVRIALRELWGRRAHDLGQRIGEARSTEERLRVLGAALCRLSAELDAPPADMGFVFHALKTESAGPGMSVILDRLDVSPRTLRRRCVDAFGYGPKTLDRILRFQRFLALARKPGRGGLSDLAFQAGYADQPHLTREVRRLTTLSPTAILAQVRR